VFLWSGNFRIADDYVERLIDYAGRHSLEPPRAGGVALKGAIAIAQDNLRTGIDLLRGALAILTTLKLNLFLTVSTGALAEGLLKSGQLEEALLTINRAIERATDCGRHSTWPYC
jgi:hypothetical protein